MGYVKARIINCRRASIRRTPWIPLKDKDIVGIKEGSRQEENTIAI